MAELDDIRSFIAVVEAGGFGRAAQTLGLAKSIVSRRVSRLEEELGTRLLSRTTRGVAATEAGLEFKARSERILAELEEAREAVAQRAGGVAGRLRLAMPMTFGNRHVAPLLGELAQLYPRLEIDVQASDRYVDLIGERFDAAIRIGSLKDSSLIARKIAPVHATVVGSPAYLARRGAPATVADLAGHDLIGTMGPRWTSEWQFAKGRWRLDAPPRLVVNTVDGVLAAAEAGLGIANLLSYQLAEAVDAGRLISLLADEQPPALPVHLLFEPSRAALPAVRLFIDAMKARLRMAGLG